MSEERVCKQGTAKYYYEIEQEKVCITAVAGVGSVLELPELLDGFPVTKIGKKALLGCHALTKVIFPATVRELDSWALAQCRNLTTVVLLGNQVVFGSGVFEDCDKITYICLGKEEPDDLSVLLAALPSRMQAEYLLQAGDVGTEAWYQRWDQKLTAFLDEDDEEGYTTLVLCGEEDIIRSVPGYIKDKRMAKAALCYIRLRYCLHISEASRKLFETYILKHTKGCSTDEAWKVLIRDFGEEIEYFKLLADLGGITAAGIDEMLIDLGENHAEAKAFLMKYQAEHFGGGDIFDQFTL